MHQEPRDVLAQASYLADMVCNSLILVEICLDCMEHEVDDLEPKLRVLLSCLHGDLGAVADDLPYRLKLLQHHLPASGYLNGNRAAEREVNQES